MADALRHARRIVRRAVRRLLALRFREGHDTARDRKRANRRYRRADRRLGRLVVRDTVHALEGRTRAERRALALPPVIRSSEGWGGGLGIGGPTWGVARDLAACVSRYFDCRTLADGGQFELEASLEDDGRTRLAWGAWVQGTAIGVSYVVPRPETYTAGLQTLALALGSALARMGSVHDEAVAAYEVRAGLVAEPLEALHG